MTIIHQNRTIMKINTKLVLKFLYILSWIIFVGVSIEAGGYLSNSFYTFFINQKGANSFWPGLDLSSLYEYDHGYFLVETLLMSIAAVLKACIFYQILKILHNKDLNISQPFTSKMGRFIFIVAYFSLLIGLFSWWGSKYAEWFVKQGVKMPDIEHLRLAGADVWLFMSATLFVIAQLFKRGIEMQTENELTV